MKRIIRANTAVLKDRLISNCQISVVNDKITAIDEGFNEIPDGYALTDLKDLILSPGFIDEHIHGGYGADVLDCTYDSLNTISLYKLKEGVTSFCPTIATASFDIIKKALSVIADTMDTGVAGAKILGSFLEGPYISEIYSGSHRKNYIRKANVDEIKDLIHVSRNTIITVLLAPEQNNAYDVIRYLVKNGINVAIGHTDSMYYEALTAIDMGANISTHTFNSMRPMQHREPGTVGAVLNSDKIYAEIIYDNIHVNLPTIEILLRCKTPKKVILVTDCILTGGLPDGEYNLRGRKIIVKDFVAKNEHGTMAGCTLTLNEAVKNMKLFTGISLVDAVNMASLNPAEALCLSERIGSIDVGKQADLTAFDANFNVAFTMIDGEIKYRIK